ncbi:hypothetical protein NPIL_600871 [Nephila pilipes]|uniref:Uncharacterized protein n=1 Tax=Nephila pilipes TaxID=299642 RepID=A0A8X6MM42_NEPPI|nr:hypothetical protein NPIL_600871 [Nephila pilipes]
MSKRAKLFHHLGRMSERVELVMSSQVVFLHLTFWAALLHFQSLVIFRPGGNDGSEDSADKEANQNNVVQKPKKIANHSGYECFLS